MRKITSIFGVFLLLLAFAPSAFSQMNISGKVTDEKGNAMTGVSVIAKKTTVGAITDLNGNYKITVPGNSGTLMFSFLGYKTVEKAVSSSADNVNVTMSPSQNSLDEVVISGLASNVQRRNLANSVDKISARELSGVTTQQTMDGALYGKFKGANITSNSGSPGGGVAVKLRGITSITGSSQPLYIVDGIYVDNSEIAAGLNSVSQAAAGGSASNQDNPSNRIADLTPEDIESIEILKGASAASIYGSRASSGVIVITTKKGQAGKTRVSFDQSVGMATILNRLGNRQFTAETAEASFGASGLAAFQAANASGNIFDLEDQLYGNRGMLYNTHLSISGGDERTKFYGAVLRKNESGIVENTGYDKTSLRFNFSHKISRNLDLGVNTNFVTSSADRGYFNNDNTGTTMGISFVSTPTWVDLRPDDNGNYPNNPNAPSNFLQTRDLVTNNESVNRFIAGANLTWKIRETERSSLRLIGNAGIDKYTLVTNVIFPRELQFQKNGNGTNGASIQGNTTVNNTNTQAFLVHNFYPSQRIGFTTQAGVLALNFDRNTILATATQLVGSQTNIDQAGSVAIEHTKVPQTDYGFYLQEEVNFSDIVIATVGLRGDKSSNNGDANKMYYYPKANVALNIHEMGFWGVDGVNQLKLRAAYGEAGQFAQFGSTFTSLGNAQIAGQAGSLVNTLRGNNQIGPERQKEIEGGIDIAFFGGRVTFDITAYRKFVDNLILNVQVPSSTGYSNQVLNAAQMENKGIEMGLSAAVVNNKSLKWNSGVNFWFNRNKITKLDVPAFNLGAFGATLGTYRIEEGKSATQIVGIPAVNGELTNYGNSDPRFQISWTNNLNFGRFDLSFLLHAKQGVQNVNLSTLLFDLSGTSPDYDLMTLDPEGKLKNGDYRVSQLGTSAAVFVEDASYLRLREIGLFYNIPLTSKMISGLRVGASGYNLLNFFSYNSYDPEVSNFGGSGFSSSVEVTPYPSAKRVFFHLSAKF